MISEEKFKEMEHELSDNEINRLCNEFTGLTDKKKQLSEQDLRSMLCAQRCNLSQPQAAPEMRT
jgi:isopropylmalate/homocitrate/citramalate synthase